MQCPLMLGAGAAGDREDSASLRERDMISQLQPSLLETVPIRSFGVGMFE